MRLGVVTTHVGKNTTVELMQDNLSVALLLTSYLPSAQQLSSNLEAATAVASDVTTTIMAQRLELDNKNKTVEMLQKALSQQRELTVYHAREMEKEGQKRLELQREEYESAVQRHQCFIDQVSRREEELCSQVSHGFCASLVRRPYYCLCLVLIAYSQRGKCYLKTTNPSPSIFVLLYTVKK